MITQLESNKRTRTSTTEEVDSPNCGNCKKLELKLRTINNEISSQKLIIELLMDDKQSKRTSQLQQANLKTEQTMQVNHDSEFQSVRSRTRKKCSSHDSLNSKFYQIPTSNRYDVLSGCPEHSVKLIHKQCTNILRIKASGQTSLQEETQSQNQGRRHLLLRTQKPLRFINRFYTTNTTRRWKYSPFPH